MEEINRPRDDGDGGDGDDGGRGRFSGDDCRAAKNENTRGDVL